MVGIAPASFHLDGDADVFTPLEQRQNTDPRMQNRSARFLRVMARLRPGFRLAEGRAELALIARYLAGEYPKSNAGLSMIAYPLQKELVGDVGAMLWLLLSAVGVVLLIACVNIASLLLARAVSRERELAMRVALGAGRSRLARQCLTESAMLGLGGGVLGVVLAFVSVHPFVAFWPGSLPRAEEVHLDWRVLVFAVGAGGASSRARRRTGAPRWSAKYCGKVTPLTQRICNLRDRPRRGAAGLGRNAWAHVAGTLISRTRFQSARRNGRTLRAFSRRARGSRAGSHGLAGRTRSCSTRPGR